MMLLVLQEPLCQGCSAWKNGLLMFVLIPWAHCLGLGVIFCLFVLFKTGGSSHAEGAIKRTNSVQSSGRRTGESLECSQMEKIRGDVSASSSQSPHFQISDTAQSLFTLLLCKLCGRAGRLKFP